MNILIMHLGRSIDQSNAAVLDELCGSVMAKTIGITDHSPRAYAASTPRTWTSIRTFARAAALPGGARRAAARDRARVRTVSQALAEAGFDITTLDIAVARSRSCASA
jgi:hypothetical protein